VGELAAQSDLWLYLYNPSQAKSAEVLLQKIRNTPKENFKGLFPTKMIAIFLQIRQLINER